MELRLKFLVRDIGRAAAAPIFLDFLKGAVYIRLGSWGRETTRRRP
jgi:hypothetical protein